MALKSHSGGLWVSEIILLRPAVDNGIVFDEARRLATRLC
jgi:hypothetical protein